MVFRAVIRLGYGYDMVPPLFSFVHQREGGGTKLEGSCCAGHFRGGALMDPLWTFVFNVRFTTIQLMEYYV